MEIALKKERDIEEYKEVLEKRTGRSGQADNNSKKIYSFSQKQTKEKTTLNLEKTNIEKICREVLSQLKPLAKEKKIHLEFKSDEKDITIDADQDKNKNSSSSIFWKNGIKYNKEMGKVKLSLKREEKPSGNKS